MKFSPLGRTGMKVSRLCVGTWNFGKYTDEKEAFLILEAALDAGINFIDTSNAYPDVGLRGKSEEIIGRWFAQGGGRRESVVLATKVYSFTENPHDGPNDGHGLSIYKIRRHIEQSLKRLNSEHVELYQMHHVDRDVSWEELWDAFESLFYQGKIDYAGACNFAAMDLMEAQAKAKERHFLGLSSAQDHYNLLCRLPELELVPTARHLGIGLLPYSPLAGGKLAGKINRKENEKSRRQDSVAIGTADKNLPEQMNMFSALCRELGEEEADVAVAWLLANPAVTAPVIGPRTAGQLKSALRAVEIDLDDTVMEKLDKIFPGPGGPAPEAYAW